MNGVSSEIYFILPWPPRQNPLGKRQSGRNSAPEAQIGATQRINRELDKPSGSRSNTPLIMRDSSHFWLKQHETGHNMPELPRQNHPPRASSSGAAGAPRPKYSTRQRPHGHCAPRGLYGAAELPPTQSHCSSEEKGAGTLLLLLPNHTALLPPNCRRCELSQNYSSLLRLVWQLSEVKSAHRWAQCQVKGSKGSILLQLGTGRVSNLSSHETLICFIPNCSE